MLLSVLITKDELTTFLSAVAPLRIVIDEQRGRCLVLGKPQLELVPNEGIRLRGDARLTWDLVGLAIPVTIQAWQFMLRPRIATRGGAYVLVFVPVLEALDLKGVPAFVDGKLTEAIKTGMAQSRDKLAWDFSRTLSKRFQMPARAQTLAGIGLTTVGGEVVVTENELRLEARLEATAEKRIGKSPGITDTAKPFRPPSPRAYE